MKGGRRQLAHVVHVAIEPGPSATGNFSGLCETPPGGLTPGGGGGGVDTYVCSWEKFATGATSRRHWYERGFFPATDPGPQVFKFTHIHMYLCEKSLSQEPLGIVSRARRTFRRLRGKSIVWSSAYSVLMRDICNYFQRHVFGMLIYHVRDENGPRRVIIFVD